MKKKHIVICLAVWFGRAYINVCLASNLRPTTWSNNRMIYMRLTMLLLYVVVISLFFWCCWAKCHFQTNRTNHCHLLCYANTRMDNLNRFISIEGWVGIKIKLHLLSREKHGYFWSTRFGEFCVCLVWPKHIHIILCSPNNRKCNFSNHNEINVSRMGRRGWLQQTNVYDPTYYKLIIMSTRIFPTSIYIYRIILITNLFTMSYPWN